MEYIRKFFGIQNSEEKIKEYRDLLNQKKEIKKSIDVAAESFAEHSSTKEIEPERYAVFLKDHTKLVGDLQKQNSSIEKSIKRLENDKAIADELKDIAFCEQNKELYKAGFISKSVYADLLKAKRKVTQYADILVMRGPKLLVLARAEDSVATGEWCIPGGHVDMGEKPIDAAVRELREETGIDLLPANMIPVGRYQKDGCDIHYFMTYVDPDSPISTILDSRECAGSEWIYPESEIDKYSFIFDMKDNVKRILGLQIKDFAGVVMKSFAEGKISEKDFTDWCNKNKELVEKSKNKHYFSHNERKDLADKGEAMPNGKFPIRNEQDLEDATRLVGSSSEPKSEVMAWIKKRAKELGLEHKLPEAWKEKAMDTENTKGLAPESIEGDVKQTKVNDIEKSLSTLTEIHMTIADENYAQHFIELLTAIQGTSTTGQPWSIDLHTDNGKKHFEWKNGLFKVIELKSNQATLNDDVQKSEDNDGFKLLVTFNDLDQAELMKSMMEEWKDNGKLDIDSVE